MSRKRNRKKDVVKLINLKYIVVQYLRPFHNVCLGMKTQLPTKYCWWCCLFFACSDWCLNRGIFLSFFFDPFLELWPTSCWLAVPSGSSSLEVLWLVNDFRDFLQGDEFLLFVAPIQPFSDNKLLKCSTYKKYSTNESPKI